MTLSIIITLCVLLLLAYIFDLTSSKTRIPTVIILLVLGYLVRQGADFLNVTVPDLSMFLKIFGTLGLILIVLEGGLDLEFNKSKLKVINKSFLISILSVAFLSFIFTVILQLMGETSIKESLINAIPICVISSAIAIPTVQNLSKEKKEFVIYESSFSDVLGVLFFDFLITHEVINGHAFGEFGVDMLILIVVSFLATILLLFLLRKINHHIKFIPIIILIVLIYAVAEVYHLPALIFILIFGLFIGNLGGLQEINLIKKLNPEILLKEVTKFSELVNVGAFLIRTLFFLIFGFLIETSELLNPSTFLLAIAVVAIIFLSRWAIILLFKLEVKPLVFVAPRGLITILLFLAIPEAIQSTIINKSLIIQVIVLSAIVMMVGMILCKAPSPVIKTQTDDEGTGDEISDDDNEIESEESVDDEDSDMVDVTSGNTSNRIDFDEETDRFE
ncbi:MAG: cation:proton antiporter [Bacteroidales bacterium]|nr:cation:proton antiporter [Bacteroidales bacterium]